ncbi:hypothetical protein HBH70_187720 [Parastagonospora nodorum]|nr:hypothetical protein HBI10_200080 [Parastagonospora nodorum]KAH4012221.1 hypothetical protein HBI13_190070 [Parastagonospora nodorum]KAH4803120.1 hypothetical protein HBH61_178280 [Parastagonospora nodorum]KAH4841559.1 hypothetical protein HBH75_225100 [Parastagonospora nodorum]KAH4896961.1 hypothetical protein HBI80_199360 [Parastagonospora nodorum]
MDSMFSSSIREHGSIPWEDNHMKIGSGHDLHKQQSLRSPFWPCHPPTNLPGTELHTLEISSKIFRDEETLLQYMTSDTRALASVFTVFNLKASLETLKTARCSKTSMTVIKRCTITLPAEHLEHLLELSDEAESCFGRLNWYKEENAKNFMSRYGQYCITGRTRQSTFFAVSTYTADAKQELDQFASSLSADFNGKTVSVQAASAFEMGSTHVSGSIRETHEILVIGCSSRNLQHRYHTIDIQKAWVDFLEHYTPIPVLAHLTHYANIDIRIPHPEGPLSITEDFRNAAELAQLLQIAARSNRLVGARTFESSVESAILRLADLHVYAEGSDKGLQQCVTTLKNVRKELTGVWDQRRKLAEVMTETESQIETWPLNKWVKAHSTPDWKIGICPDDVQESLRDEVVEYRKDWDPESKRDGMPICLKSDIPMCLPGRRIVGAQVESGWQDDTNGWWRRTHGTLGGDTLTVAFETQHYRGGSWALIVWAVDRNLYMKV